MTDELCALLAEDLETAFPTLVRTHQDAVFATALRCSGGWHDAEDLAQETFVRAHRSLLGWEAQRIRELRPRAWLCTIVVNLARNRARDAGRRPRVVAFDDARAHAADPPRGPEAWAERSEQRGQLSAALATLPAAHREAIVLRHVAGLGYAEIAQALGAPVGTVKAQVHRGLRTLAEVLRAQGLTLEEVS
ncbi:MAG TPA: RNA polymerase sigma factor [Candidatus Dormibacteraeota bacterium]